MAEYKIELGISLNTAELNGIKDKIKGLESDPIKLRIDDTEIDSTIKGIKTELNNLGNTKGLKLDTSKLESSLTDVKGDISEIKNLLGSLGSGTNMKGLVSSIGQISTALDKASGKFDELAADLKTLNSKDFSVNIGVNLGGSNSVNNNINASDVIRNQVIPELQRQEKELARYLAKHYGTNEFNAINTLLSKTGNDMGGVGGVIATLDKFNQPIKKGELNQRMQDLRNYINLIKQAAAVEGIDLSSVLSSFNGQADDLVENANNIRNGTTQVKNNLEELKNVFGSGIDGEKLSSQLDSIVTDLNEIRTALQNLSSGTSLEGLTSSFDRLSDSIEKLVQNANLAKNALDGGLGGVGTSTNNTNSGVKNLNNDLKQITITADNTSDAIDSIMNAMSGMKFNTSSIDAVTKDLEEMNIVIKEVTAKQGKNFDITVKGINDVGEAVDVIKRFNAETGNFEVISTKISKPFKEGAEEVKRFKKEAEAVDDIKFDFGLGKYDNQISQMNEKFDKLSSASKELCDSVEQVELAYREMENAIQGTGDEVADRERLIQAEKEYAAALERANNLIKIQAREEKTLATAQKLAQDKETLKLNTQNWLNENTKAAQKYGAELKRLISLLDNIDDPVAFKNIARDIKNVQKTAQVMGKTGLTAFDKLKSKVKEYMTYISAAEMFMWAEQAFRKMFDTVKEIDTAMTGLYRVTDLTSAEYDVLFNNMISSAKEYGATLNDIINATTDWVRAGFDANTSLGLAEVTTMYQHISDLDYATAAENLITAYNGFKDELNTAFSGDAVASVEYIADIFNELDK